MMPASGPASIIVGTYNDAEILEIFLAAFAVQSHPDFELVLADDGSSQDYSTILKNWAPRFRLGIQHVTHEKRGFRKSRVLNRAVHVSRYDRLIFIDLDCLPHRDFVRNHLSFLEPGTVIAGRRAHVSRDVVPTPATILQTGLGFNLGSLMRLWLRGKAHAVEHGVITPFFYESSNVSLQGCNFSVCRSDLIAVNGYNEEFEGWGKEDSELGLRLQFNGVRIRNLRNKVPQFHLIHGRLPSENPKNDAIFERTKAERRVWAPKGIAEIAEGDFQWARYGAALDGTAARVG